MPTYLVIVRDDEGAYEHDSSFVAESFDGAHKLLLDGVWLVRTKLKTAQEVAERLGIAEGGTRTAWSCFVTPSREWFGFAEQPCPGRRFGVVLGIGLGFVGLIATIFFGVASVIDARFSTVHDNVDRVNGNVDRSSTQRRSTAAKYDYGPQAPRRRHHRAPRRPSGTFGRS